MTSCSTLSAYLCIFDMICILPNVYILACMVSAIKDFICCSVFVSNLFCMKSGPYFGCILIVYSRHRSLMSRDVLVSLLMSIRLQVVLRPYIEQINCVTCHNCSVKYCTLTWHSCLASFLVCVSISLPLNRLYYPC